MSKVAGAAAIVLASALIPVLSVPSIDTMEDIDPQDRSMYSVKVPNSNSRALCVPNYIDSSFW